MRKSVEKQVLVKSLEKRILDSFRKKGPMDQVQEHAREYSRSVYALWKDTSVSLGRSAVLVFLLMALFELLVYQHASAIISIGTLTLVNAPIVQIALPTIVAYAIYDGDRLTVRWLRLELIFMQLMKIYAPEQQENGLDRLIEPNLPSLWGIGALSFLRTGDIADSFIRRVHYSLLSAMLLAVPVAFECQAYYRLFQKFGYYNVFLWINAVITTLLGICTGLYVWFDRAGRATWWEELQ
jgi:hypothetical protein